MARILVIDDDQDIREVLVAMLEYGGHEVVTACDGNEGIKAYHKNPADIVITDIVMPDKEGVETIVALRKSFPDVKIIAISGGGRMGSSNYLDVAKALGANKTFSKPLERKQIMGAIQEIISPD